MFEQLFWALALWTIGRHVIRVVLQYLWFRFAYTGGWGDPLHHKFLGHFGEGMILPWWAAILRRVMEPGPR